MRLTFDAGVRARHEARPFAGAGGDAGLLLLVTAGAEPLTIVECTSEDDERVPSHLHPWDEFVSVLDGEMEFVAGETTGGGGPGTMGEVSADGPTLERNRYEDRRAKEGDAVLGEPIP
jgi:hypothetical protein